MEWLIIFFKFVLKDLIRLSKKTIFKVFVKFKPDTILKIYPENFHFVHDPKARNPSELDRFRVTACFRILAKCQITVLSVDFVYDNSTAFPEYTRITIDQIDYQSGSSTIMREQKKILADKVARISIQKRFICKYESCPNDYKTVIVKIELLIPSLWNRIMIMTISGLLAAGGSLKNYKLRLQEYNN